jgi:hypothetical protein
MFELNSGTKRLFSHSRSATEWRECRGIVGTLPEHFLKIGSGHNVAGPEWIERLLSGSFQQSCANLHPSQAQTAE